MGSVVVHVRRCHTRQAVSHLLDPPAEFARPARYLKNLRLSFVKSAMRSQHRDTLSGFFVLGWIGDQSGKDFYCRQDRRSPWQVAGSGRGF